MRWIRSGLWAALLFLTVGAHAGVNTWSERGPYGGTVFNVVIDPKDARIAYASTGRNLYRSHDSGSTWSQLPQYFGTTGIAKIRLDPSNHNRLYVSARATGLWRSNDGGTSFTQITAQPTDPDVDGPNGLDISSDGNTIYYSTAARKLFRSTDGGATFSERPRMPAASSSLIVDPNNSAIVYAASDTGLMKTINGGDSWIDLPLPAGVTYVRTMTLIPGSPNQVYFSSAGGVYRSSDDGASWSTPIYAGYNVFSDLAAPEILYLGPDSGSGLLYRHEGGNSFGLTSLPTRILSLATGASSPQLVLAGTAMGIFRSNDYGTTWSRSDQLLDGMEVGELVTGAGRVYASSSYGELGIGGTGDDVLYRSIVSSAVTAPGAISTTPIAPHPSNPDIVLASPGKHGLRFSLNGGVSWNDGPVDLAEPDVAVQAIAFDPSNPQVSWVFARSPSTTARLYRINEGFITITPVSAGPDVSARQLFVDPRNASRLFVVSSDRGIYRSVDAGITWTHVLEDDIVNLAIDPLDSRRMYAAGSGKLYTSDDNGITFQSVSAFDDGRYGAPIWVAVDPTLQGIVYVIGSKDRDVEMAPSQEYFVMRSVDGAQSWERIENGSAADWALTRLAVNAASPTDLLGSSPHGVRSFRIAPDVTATIQGHSGTRTNNVPASFQVQLQNTGPLAATDLTVDIAAPAGSTAVSAQHPLASCTTSGTSVRCSLPYLQVNEPLIIDVDYTPPANARLSVQANVYAREHDPNESNNVATASASSTAPPSTGGNADGGGGGGGGSMSLPFTLSLGLLALMASFGPLPRRRRPG